MHRPKFHQRDYFDATVAGLGAVAAAFNPSIPIEGQILLLLKIFAGPFLAILGGKTVRRSRKPE